MKNRIYCVVPLRNKNVKTSSVRELERTNISKIILWNDYGY